MRSDLKWAIIDLIKSHLRTPTRALPLLLRMFLRDVVNGSVNDANFIPDTVDDDHQRSTAITLEM